MGWEDRAYNREGGGGVPPVQFRLPLFTAMTLTVMGVNLALFLTKAYVPLYRTLIDYGSLRFGDVPAWQVWRWITYQYLHGDGGHVFFNLLGLYFFLPPLEQQWGWRKALGFYTLGGIAAGVVFTVMSLTATHGVYLIGASGSIFACLGAVALLFPERQLILLLFSVPIRVAAALFALLFLLTAVGDHDYSNAAHLGGLAFGFLAPWLAAPFVEKQRRRVETWSVDRERRAEADEQAAVDRILDKVAKSGMHSLTGGEKRTLKRASDNQKKRDALRGRR